MSLDINMLKKVCGLYNRILSVRLDNEQRNVWFKLGRRNAVLAIEARKRGGSESEAFVFQLLINYFESQGELCYDKVEYDDNDDLVIHLKTID